MPEVQGIVNLCLPAVVLNAILRRLIAEETAHGEDRRSSAARMRELMSKAKVEVLLLLPAVRLRAQEIAELEPGAILRLPVPRHRDLRS